MAFTSTGVVEIRTAGNAANGAYFDASLAGAGTDYSQQDAAQLSVADGVCANNTTLTSVTGGFTTAMIGNGVHIAGVNFTTGFYVITARADTNTVTLDRNPTTGAAASVGVCNVGGACTTLIAPLSTTLVAGCTVYIKAGAYTWATLTTTAGSGTLSLNITGYNAARTDEPTGANRPELTMSGSFVVGTTTKIKNVSFVGNFNGNLIVFGTNCWADNCKGVQTGSPAAITFNCAADDCLTRCEAVCASGAGAIVGQCTLLHACYMRSSATGFSAQRSNTLVSNCIVDSCTTHGINIDTNNPLGVRVIDTTVYGCNYGVYMVERASGVYSTVVSGCAIGLHGGGASTSLNMYTDLSNTINLDQYLPQEFGTTGNPNLIDPANKDFTLFARSPAVATGGQVTTNIGVVGTYNNNMGAYKAALDNGQIISAY